MDMEKLNRVLASVALVLGIVWLVLTGLVAYRLIVIGNEVQHAIDQLQTPATECYDPGGGTVCAPGGAGD